MKSHLAEYFSTVRRRKGIGSGPTRQDDRLPERQQRLPPHRQVREVRADSRRLARQVGRRPRNRRPDRRPLDRGGSATVFAGVGTSGPTLRFARQLILGHIGGFCWAEPLPEDITREAAEEYAAAVAKKMNRPISLILSRRLSIQFDREGNRTSVHEAKPGDINVPYLRFGRRKVSFDLGTGTMQVLNEPQKPGQKKSSPTLAASSFGAASRSSRKSRGR